MHPHKKEADRARETRHERLSDEKMDKSLIKKAIGEHDKQLHRGKHTKIKLKDGGSVEGKKPKHHMHRAKKRAEGGRMAPDSGPEEKRMKEDNYGAGHFMWRADGGRTDGMSEKKKGGGKGSKGHHTTINVISSPPAQNRPIPVPVPVGGGAGGLAAPRPPLAPPPIAGGPPGMPPRPIGAPGMGGAPLMPRARGGRTVKLTGGAGSGEGRLEQTKFAKTIKPAEDKGDTADYED